MEKSVRLVLNISGQIYETRLKTLRRFPKTLLGDPEKRKVYYCATLNQYFFERNRVFFDAILFFYQSGGLLCCPPGIPYDLFEEECRYFELPEEAIEKIKPLDLRELQCDLEDDLDDGDKSGSLKSKIWDVLQNPETSSFARAFSIFSLFMIVISVVASCLETMPALSSSSKSLFMNPWAINELALNSWFLFEFLMGTLCAPKFRKYLSSTMTWVDIIAVVPYFVILSISTENLHNLGFLRIIRLVRVTRMFRLSKHSARLKIVSGILSSCVDEFKALLLCLLMIVILAGSLMYYLEEQGSNGSEFTTIPQGMYWAIQSITTVGYGDIYPYYLPGKLFASAFMLFGAVTLSIPVLSIVAKFEADYDC